MGINASKSINNVSNKIMNELEISGINASRECEVNVGNIVLINPDKCTVTNQNRCSTDSDMAIEVIAKAAMKAFKEATSIQKSLLIPGININDSNENIQKLIKSMLLDKCRENSATTISIAESDLLFQGCLNENIININAGSAVSNCAIKTIINTIIAASIKENDMKEDNKINEQPFSKLFGGIGIISAIALLIIIFIVFSVLFLMWFTKKIDHKIP